MLLGRSEGKLYTEIRERGLQYVGGQTEDKGAYSVLAGVTEGKVYRVCWLANLKEMFIVMLGRTEGKFCTVCWTANLRKSCKE